MALSSNAPPSTLLNPTAGLAASFTASLPTLLLAISTATTDFSSSFFCFCAFARTYLMMSSWLGVGPLTLGDFSSVAAGFAIGNEGSASSTGFVDGAGSAGSKVGASSGESEGFAATDC
jgi:hypothetical protein